jgi:hypothetical protein
VDEADCGGLSPSLCVDDESSDGTEVTVRSRVMRAGVESTAWNSSADVCNLCKSRLPGCSVSLVGFVPVSLVCCFDRRRAATDDAAGLVSLLPEGLFEERGAALTALWDIVKAGTESLVVIQRRQKIYCLIVPCNSRGMLS